jgi:uncharacterized protein YgiM (DUF1202 family)
MLGRNANASWVKVRVFSGQEGWVNASLIQPNVAISSLPVADSPSLPSAPVVSTTGALNVRSGPGTNHGVVATIQQQQRITLLGRNSNTTWIRIRLTNGQEGWISATPLIQANVALTNLPVLETAAATATPASVVNTGVLNVRSGPGVNYSVVTTVSQGESVTLLGRNNAASWVKIQLNNGQEGWVNASLIQPSVAISTLPVIDSPGLTPSATVASGALNVRTGPGIEYGIVTVSYQGHTLALLGRNANASWVRVRTFNGQEGWVNATLIQANVALSSLPVVAGTGFTAAAEVTSDSANVYTGPGTQYSVITVSQQGHVVHLLGRNANTTWIRVRVFSGQEGWINASLIQPNVTLGSLPVVQ